MPDSKSSAVPAFKTRLPLPSTSKSAASAPVKVIVLVPSASSVMVMAVNTTSLAVFVFSGKVCATEPSAKAVGSSFTAFTVPVAVPMSVTVPSVTT